jgi:SAM-dependent methyltransferase
MEHPFDKDYWETHWREVGGTGPDLAANPYLVREVTGLAPGTALDAGCGEGAEAIWLAQSGWDVTAADISATALALAAERAPVGPGRSLIDWVEADLSVWDPERQFDLVMTHYAHPALPQLVFYERIANWVAPSGTLLIVGHLHHHHDHDHEHDHEHEREHGHQDDSLDPPEETLVTADAVTALLDPDVWDVVTADEASRQMTRGDGRTVELHDVIVRATRRS